MQATRNEFLLKRIQPTSYVFSKEKKLGQGSFGQVYLGYDQKNQCPVAIKTISYAKLNQSNINQQTLAQKLASQLSNMQLARDQRLVRLISPHQYSLLIQSQIIQKYYCNQGSLQNYLNAKGCLSEFETLSFFKDILQGLQCLHQKKIVHRDMKPANLLLHNHRLKIADLGFSRNIQNHSQVLKSIVGTPLYMSPQILCNTTYTEKSDIWSLGVILYEMLTGEAPWRVKNLQEIQEKVKYKPQFPKHVTVSDDTKRIILRMLEYEEKSRVGWKELFQNYLYKERQQSSATNHSQMQQQPSLLAQSLAETSQHFLCSLALQSQPHIAGILQKNGQQPIQFWQHCTTARQFFQKSKQIKHELEYVSPVINHYVETRNMVAYLIRLFMECYACSEDLRYWGIYGAMFMTLKYSIGLTEAMHAGELVVKMDKEEAIEDSNRKVQVFLNSNYYRNFQKLLQIDLAHLRNLLPLYTQNSFQPKLIQLSKTQPQAILNLQQNLKPFFNSQSTSLKFSQFWFKNQCRQLFNAFKQLQKQKNKQQFDQKWLIIPRMIYQYEKSMRSNISIFANKGNRSDMARRLESWMCEKWRGKFKEIKGFQIESMNSFLNRQLVFRPIPIFGMGGFGSTEGSM